MNPKLRAWSGLPIGLLSWYGAHELGFYVTSPHCNGKPWLIPAIHALALLLSLCGAALSAGAIRTETESSKLGAWIGMGAGLLFAFVILCQGVAATFFYNGCER